MDAPAHIRFSRFINGQNGRYQVLRSWGVALLRRGLDVAGAVIGLLLLSPLFAFIGILLRLDTPGPIFYRGARIGKNGSTFDIIKFRTMYESPESYDGPRVTGSGDSRITSMGQWLRDTKLNELPQLWNVLVGDMSLFGPRPEDPDYVKLWPEDIRQVLLSVRPGITSPASIVYRDEEKIMQASNVEEFYLNEILPSKLRLDWVYVKHRSILGDLDVLLWTLVTLLPQISDRKIPDHLLYWGPISRFTTRHFSWFTIDVFVTFGIIGALGIIWRSFAPLNVGLNMAVIFAIIMVVLFSSANAALGLSRMWWSKAKPGYALVLFTSAAAATAVILLLNQLLSITLPSTLIIVCGIAAWMGFILVRYRLRLVSSAARHWLNVRPGTTMLGERVLIVGAGVVGRFAASILDEEDLLPAYTVVGMVDDDPRKNGVQIGDYRVLGTTQEITLLAEEYGIGIIVFAITAVNDSERARILSLCQKTKARVIFLPDVVHTIKTRFLSTSEDYPAAPTFVSKFGEELIELNKLLQDGQICEAQDRIRALQEDFTRI